MGHSTKDPTLDSGQFKDLLATTPTNPATGFVKVLNRNGALVIRDSLGNEAGIGSGAGGTNYFDNGLFENGIDGASIFAGAATLSAETTAPIQGGQSLNIRQDTGAAAEVRFAITVSDAYVEDESLIIKHEAYIRLDAADGADATYGLYDVTAAAYISPVTTLAGGGVLNIISELITSPLVDGNTIVGRLIRTDNTNLREIIVDKLNLTPDNGVAIIPTIKFQRKITPATTSIGTSRTTIFTFNGLTIGSIYRITLNVASGAPDAMEAFFESGGDVGFGSALQAVTGSGGFNCSIVFTAGATTLLCRLVAQSASTILSTYPVAGGGTDATWALIEELTTYVATTDFT